MKRWKTAMLIGAASALLAAALLAAAGCAKGGNIMDGDGMLNTYRQISQAEAREIMEREKGFLIVDVRRPDEFAAGHIPGAVNVPNEEIADESPAALPDQQQKLLVYCRSGRRSKEAAQKLFDLGYTDVCEFGGIIDWTGETVTEEPVETATEALPSQSAPVMLLEANGNRFTVILEDNASAKALIEKLQSEPLTVTLHDYGDFEKVGPLPWDLPADDERITTKPGDVILYQGNQITVYYDENTWSFTKLGSITGATRETLLSAFGEGDVTVTLSLEFPE